jgi:hypothetical protein
LAIDRQHKQRPSLRLVSLSRSRQLGILFLDASRLMTLESKEMVLKNTFVILAVVAILLTQFADCMSAMTMDQQSMECCGSMPCDPSNQSHDCCKSMASSQSPIVLPATHVTLHLPVIDVANFLPTPLLLELCEAPRNEFGAPQHSPPELYTLHSSLLI